MSVEIFDIDGTLTTTGNNPNNAMIENLRKDAADGTEIVIVSARPVSRMQETRTWLAAHDVPHARVYLNDFDGAGQGPNVGLAFKEYKYKQLIEEYGLEEIDYAVDNDPEVRAMAQRLGVEAYSPDEYLAHEAEDMAQPSEQNNSDSAEPVVRSEEDATTGDAAERYELKEKEIRSLSAGEFRVTDAGNGQRTLTGYASLFNQESAGLPFTEIIAPGAFKRSIARANAGQRVISLLFGHDETRALATTLSGRLKLTEDEMGLRVEAQLDPADPDAASVLSKVANESAAMGWSFGFNTPKGGDAWDGNVRTLKEVILGEVSILSAGQQPAYPQTIGGSALRHVAKDLLGVDGDLVSDTMEAIKLGATLNEEQTAALDQIRVKLGAKMEERATWTIGAARDLPVNEDRSWDGQGAADRVFAAAGFDSESPDYEMARKAFLVYDADAPELRGSYKLGFADIVDGELVAIRDGLRAAASRLPLTDIPQDAAERARAVLDSYFGSRSVHPSVAEAQVILAWMTNETI